MSGFEIAGVVLAIVPILRSYGPIYRGLKDFGAYHRDVSKVQKQLLVVKTQFYREVRALFEHTLNEDTARELLQNPQSNNWDVATIQESVIQSYEDGLGSVDALRASLELALETLQQLHTECSPAGPPAQELSTSRVLGKRLHWSVSKKDKIEKLIHEIRGYNADLRKFNLDQVPRVSKSVFRKPNILHFTWTALSATQQRYTRIYRALSPVWDHGCENLSLGLDFENGSDEHCHVKNIPERFSIVIGLTNAKPKPKLFELTLKVQQRAPPSPEAASPKVISKLPVSRKSQTSKPPAPKSPTSRKQVPASAKLSDGGSSKGLADDPQPLSALSDALSRALKSGDKQKAPSRQSSLLGYFEDSKSEIFEAYITSHLVPSSSPSKSLADLLSVCEALDRPGTGLTLDPARRYYLAYSLGLSLLRLYSSPWLAKQDWWQSDNIAFFPNLSLQHTEAQGSPNPGTFPVPHIAARARLDPASPPGTSAYHAPTSPSPVSLVNNHQLFAFGVILLEIALGRRLAAEATSEERAKPDLTEFLVAKRLEKEKRATGSMGPRYHKAVSRCISCRFDTEHMDLRAEELQREFYFEVVCELRNDWQKFRN